MEVGIENWVYTDTDCNKFIGESDYFDRYNESVKLQLTKLCKEFDFDPALLNPKDLYGQEHFLGMWEDEGVCDRFKVLTKKCYITETNGWNTCTVAGICKDKITQYFNRVKKFEDFNMMTVIPADYTGIWRITKIGHRVTNIAPMSSTLCSENGNVIGEHLRWMVV